MTSKQVYMLGSHFRLQGFILKSIQHHNIKTPWSYASTSSKYNQIPECVYALKYLHIYKVVKENKQVCVTKTNSKY